MIYITGDTHIPIDIKKLNTKNFSEQKTLTKEDYVIICGDFGGVWNGKNEEKYWLNWLKNKNFTTLFIDGNHENFNMLKNFEIADLLGGKVQKIDEGIFHLMRGEVYNIDKKKIFAFGGANSHDKEYRTEGISWWKEEIPSAEEYENARKNLEKNGRKVDYIITHCAPGFINSGIFHYENDGINDFLDEISNKIDFKKWFFGHYHDDKNINEKYTCVFDEIIPIE